MTRSTPALAIAAALSLGIVTPTTTPTVREIPSSNGDILIANGGDASAPTGTAGFKDHDVGAESTPGKTTAPSSVIE